MRFRQTPRGHGVTNSNWTYLADTLEVPLVLGHEHAARLPAREREQDVVAERLRDATDLQPLLSRHVGEEVARAVPRAGRRRDHPPGSLEDAEDMSFECPSILFPLHTGAQFLGDDDTEILERRERSVEALELVVCGGIAKRTDEELRVEHVPSA